MERKRIARGVIRGAITKLATKMQQALEEDSTDKMEELLEQLQEKAARLRAYDDEILNLAKDEDIRAEVEKQEEYTELILTWQVKANRLLTPQNVSTVTTVNYQPTNSGTGARKKIKLPKLEIGKFDGTIRKWPTFWDQFKSSIHENSDISDIDKFNYLRTLLLGKALNAIDGLLLTSANYAIAINLLTERFGQKELIINEHMAKLLSLQPVKEVHEVHKLRHLYDESETNIRGLKALGVTSGTYGGLLLPVLMKLVPEVLLREWKRKKPPQGTTHTLDDFMSFFKIEVEIAESIALMKGEPEIPAQYSTKPGGRVKDSFRSEKIVNPSVPSTSVLALPALNSNPKTNCYFCEAKNHKSDECTLVTDIKVRRDCIQRQRRCFVCLQTKHIAKSCKRAPCRFCKRRHHHSLCFSLTDKEKNEDNEDQKPEPTTTTDTAVLNLISDKACSTELELRNEDEDSTMLQTAIAVASGNHVSTQVRILLDNGSQKSFVRNDIAKLLGLLPVKVTKMRIHPFGSSDTSATFQDYYGYKVNLHGRDNACIEVKVYGVPHICHSLPECVKDQTWNTMESRGLQMAEEAVDQPNSEGRRIDVLLGADCYWQIVSGRSIRLGPNTMASDSLFGWLLHGSLSKSSETQIRTDLHVIEVSVELSQTPETETLDNQLKRFWETETLGVEDNNLSRDEQLILDTYKQDVQYLNGRYSVRLPWNGKEQLLCSNWNTAKVRLNAVLRRIAQDQLMLTRYRQAMKDYLEAGHIEVVDLSTKSELPTFYLPHHSVVKEDRETTKVRVVFDGSCKSEGGLSLNDCLHVGPNLNPEMLKMLIRFRMYRIPLIADMEKAFLQVGIQEVDRDAIRLLWITDDWKPGTPLNLIGYRFTRAPFGVSSSTFLLAMTVRQHAEKFQDIVPRASKVLDQDLYVDDLICGENSVEDAHKLYQDCKSIVKSAGMKFCKWTTSSESLLKMWQEDKNEENIFARQDLTEQKILGVKWNKKTDEFLFDFKRLPRPETVSKREILQSSARIFDPLGFLAPYTVVIKILMQEIWELKLNWDQPIPEKLKRRWEVWEDSIEELNRIRIPRWCEVTDYREFTGILHVFCDSSEKAYGAVIYLQQEDKPCHLLVSKTRVAPIKKVTLPRLELLAALIGARLLRYVISATGWGSVKSVCWTDSQITLHWITSTTKRWKPYVANRVNEIQRLTSVDQWQFCKGEDNPADLVTRGLTAAQLFESNTWWNGPQWLTAHEELHFGVANTNEGKEWNEVSILALPHSCSNANGWKDLLQRFSTLSRLKRVTAWILRFQYNCKNRNERRTGPLTVWELEFVKNLLIKLVQNECFPTEVQVLNRGKKLNKDSSLLSLAPWMDKDGILRVGGRLQEANLSFGERHSVLLPSNHYFTKLMIEASHRQVLHSGVTETLAQTREEYWILRGRQVIKKILHKCLICKRSKIRRCEQIEAPLPKDRIQETKPYDVSGLDYAGPVLTKNEAGQIQKSYIALFTCAVTRCVHLELVSKADTEHCLQAFRRFFGRRGVSSIIYSDNAKIFKSAEKELRGLWTAMKTSQFQDFFAGKEVEWKFIVESAPWWGGWWERMVKVVKICLKKLLGRASLSFEELATVLIEIEAVVNSRPLTWLEDSPGELEPLTPSHFLVGRRLTALPNPQQNKTKGIAVQNLQRRWKNRVRIVESFWKRWRKEYLRELRSGKFVHQPENVKDVEVGEVMIVHEEKLPRHLWKIGRVEEVFKGRDGKIRACKIKMGNGRILRRPVQLLYRFEA